jgi:hypothetical protein
MLEALKMAGTSRLMPVMRTLVRRWWAAAASATGRYTFRSSVTGLFAETALERPQTGVTLFSAAAEAWADGTLDTSIGINGPLARYAVGRMRVASHRLASVTTAARMPTVPK